MTVPGPELPFSEAVAEARRTVEQLDHVRSRAEHVTVTETSADGSVTVTVNSGGVLTDLRITGDQAGERIAALVLETMRRAQARIADRMSEVMRADDAALRDRVLAVYHDRFPEPAEPSGRPTADDEQDDGTFMRDGY
jgi:DNA-binding protein YbaB